jgi:hypothetical protein
LLPSTQCTVYCTVLYLLNEIWVFTLIQYIQYCIYCTATVVQYSSCTVRVSYRTVLYIIYTITVVRPQQIGGPGT